jgi:uncharacterized repeat protein (TIGR01451 family)
MLGSVRRAVLVVFFVAWVLPLNLAGPEDGPAVVLAQERPNQAPSKIPSIVQQRIERIDAAQSRGQPIDPARLSDNLLQVTAGGELLLEFHSARAVGPGEKAALAAVGASPILSTGDVPAPRGVRPPPNLGIILARVPHNRVAAAAALPWVVAVRPAEKNPPDVGAIAESEGVALHKADAAQSAGFNGTGVTVGVISDGVSNLAASQALAELPATVTIPAGCGVGGGDEGTAMLEIVHDMAPGATLMFCATGAGVAAHIAAQNNLVTAGVRVIAEDIPFDAEPAFQKGAAANSGDAIAATGVSVHSSAGNLGNAHAARIAAVGTGGSGDLTAFAGCPYTPANVVDLNGGAAGTSFNVTGGGTFTLQWSEPRAIFPTPGAGGFTNLDLFVFDGAGTTCLGSSTAVQANGAGDTIEQVAVAAAAGTALRIVVNVQATDGAVTAPLIDLRWRGPTAVDATTRAGSLNPDSNYTDDATSSAAANASGSTDPTAVPIEAFSGGGPVQLISTTVCPGAYPCPGPAPAPVPVAGGGGRTVGAPSWTAADGVSVSGVGGFGTGSCPATTQGDCRFGGTSASTPHAAAIDALVRDALGGAPLPADINTRLRNTATDRGAPGFDNVWGAGVLNALAATGESADLKLTKECKPDQPNAQPAGTETFCDILIDNLGPSDARDVVITDKIISSTPITITAISSTATSGAPATCPATPIGPTTDTTITCTDPVLPAGSRDTIKVTFVAMNAGDVNDTASVASATPDPNTSNNSATGRVSFRAVSDLALTKTDSPDPVVAGTNLTYTLQVTNSGPSPAPNVVVTDALSGQVSFVSATPSQGSCQAGVVPGDPTKPLKCNLGTLASGGAPATVTVIVTVKADVPTGTTLVNNAEVSSDNADSNTANNVQTASTTVTTSADVAITKTSDADSYKPSSRVTYQIAVVNNGPSKALNVAVTDNLPEIKQVIYESDTGGCVLSTPTTLTCNLGDLEASKSKTFFVYVTVKGSQGSVSNTASVASSTPDPTPANNSSTRVVTVKGGNP